MFYQTLPETQLLPSVSCFAECQLSRTRRKYHLTSVNNKTLGKRKTLDKRTICRMPYSRLSAKPQYAECRACGTRQTTRNG